VVGVDGSLWKNCSNSIRSHLVDFALLELLLVFAIFWQIGVDKLFLDLHKFYQKVSFVKGLWFGRCITCKMSHNNKQTRKPNNKLVKKRS